MRFFQKKKEALAMFGSQEIVNAFIEQDMFSEIGISINPKDYVNIDELLLGLKERKNAQYVLISNEALFGIENGKYEAVARIREQYENIEIIFFISYEDVDEKFINWAYGYSVYNIFYANSDGEFDLMQILKSISERNIVAAKQFTKNQNELLENKEKELAEIDKMLETKEKLLAEKEEEIVALRNKTLEEHAAKEEEIDFKLNTEIEKISKAKESELEAIKNQHLEETERIKEEAKKEIESLRMQTEQLKHMRSPVNNNNIKRGGCIKIGVFATSHGAGSTYTSIELGELYARAGYKVAVIAYDGKPDLLYLGKKKADYYCPTVQDRRVELRSLVSDNYDFAIIDFGTPFSIYPNGEENEVARDDELIDEFYRSHYFVGLGFSEPWHINKLWYFSEIPVFKINSIFALNEINEKEASKFSLPICSNESLDTIYDILLEWQGLSNNMQKKGLFRK